MQPESATPTHLAVPVTAPFPQKPASAAGLFRLPLQGGHAFVLHD